MHGPSGSRCTTPWTVTGPFDVSLGPGSTFVGAGVLGVASRPPEPQAPPSRARTTQTPTPVSRPGCTPTVCRAGAAPGVQRRRLPPVPPPPRPDDRLLVV